MAFRPPKRFLCAGCWRASGSHKWWLRGVSAQPTHLSFMTSHFLAVYLSACRRVMDFLSPAAAALSYQYLAVARSFDTPVPCS